MSLNGTRFRDRQAVRVQVTSRLAVRLEGEIDLGTWDRSNQ